MEKKMELNLFREYSFVVRNHLSQFQTKISAAVKWTQIPKHFHHRYIGNIQATQIHCPVLSRRKVKQASWSPSQACRAWLTSLQCPFLLSYHSCLENHCSFFFFMLFFSFFEYFSVSSLTNSYRAFLGFIWPFYKLFQFYWFF